jgi:uncharacterized protein YnzC (UPF0291/DUF896 family)
MESKTQGEIAVAKWCNLDEIETESEHAAYSAYIAGYNQSILDNIPQWKIIDINNLPKGRVITKDKIVDSTMIGRIKIAEDNSFFCEIPGTSIWCSCTHYILIENLLKLPTESE